MTLPPDSGLPAPVQRALPDHLIPERSGVTVWWSNIKREGEWILPRMFRVFTFMGNVELDLTYARMNPGISEIEIRDRVESDPNPKSASEMRIRNRNLESVSSPSHSSSRPNGRGGQRKESVRRVVRSRASPLD